MQSYAQENKEKDERDEQIDEIKREIEKLKGHCEECNDEAIPQTESDEPLASP